MQSRSANPLRRFFAPATKAATPRLRLQFQPLEERTVPATIPVTSLGDSGAGTLRQAITDANASAAADVITFDPTLFTGGPQVINITSAALPSFTVAGGPLAITGPGMNMLTVQRSSGTNFRIFNQLATGVVNTLTLTDFTIKNGNAATGGGLNMATSSVAFLDRMAIIGNTSTGTGGGIRLGSTAQLSLKNSVVSGNTASGNGAGLYFFSGGSLVMENSTVSGNIAGGTGGGMYLYGTPLAAPTTGFTASTWHIKNSTIHGNQGTIGGGVGLFLGTAGNLLIQNSTITGNNATAATGGGGISRSSGTNVITLQNTIVAGNTATTGPNILGAGAALVNMNYSASDNTAGATLSGTSGNNVIASVAALNLGPLQNNGGLTPTRLPGSGPLINAGSNALIPGGFTDDQRGTGFARILDGTVEIGAVETIPPGNPTALATASNITTAGGTTQTFTVLYKDILGPNLGLDLASITGNSTAIRVVGPNSYNELAAFVSMSGSDPNERTVTYTVPAAGGTWGTDDVGDYTISVEANQIFDLNAEPVTAGALANFTVSAPQTLTVTNATDADPGSLRDIIAQANLNINPDTILFDPSVFNAAQTISLLSALPAFGSLATAGAISVVGPGSNLLTVQRDVGAGTNFGIFTSNNGAFSLSGMKITGGNSGPSGMVLFNGGTLTDVNVTGNSSTANGTIVNLAGTLNITNSSITNNTNTAIGGGIAANAGTTLNITNSVISGNTTALDGGGIYTGGANVTIINSTISNNVAIASATGDGGGAFFGSGANVIVKNSTISGNSSNDDGAGLYFFNGGSLLLENSTMSNNTTTTAAVGGGAIYFFGTATSFIVRNSTLAGNTTATSGGAIVWPSSGGTMTIENSTIFGNTAAGAQGGGIARTSGAGTIVITNSVVSNNTNTASPDIFSAGTVTKNYSAIGSITGFTDGGGTGNIAPGTDLMLSTLGSWGGTTQTHVPLQNSPLIDVGDSTVIPPTTVTDQVGGSRLRTFGANVDIGSVEVQPNGVTVNQAVGQADPTNGDIVFDVVFDMAVTDFDISDVTLTTAAGGTVTGFSGSGTTYQVTVTGMAGEGDVQLDVAADVAIDVTSSSNTASTSTDNIVRFDQVAPTVDIAVAAGQNNPTNDAVIDFTVTFSEATTGFDGSDIDFTGSTVSGTLSALVTLVTPGVYNVAVSGMTTDGDVVINFAANAATDLIGNGNTTPTITSNTVTYDATAPTVTVEQIGAIDPTGGGSTSEIQFLATFSEAVLGLDIADIDLTGTTAAGAVVTSVTGGGTTYTITVSGMTSGGLIKASIPANATTDAATNGNTASTSTDNEVTFVLSGTIVLDTATYTVSELGAPQLTVTVKRVGGSEGTISVNYATSDITALAGSDYTTTAGTLTWANADAADQTFNIPILDDSLVEGNETFNVTLSGITVPGALGTPSAAVVTITDYEEGDITFDAASYTANEAGVATITVKRLNGGNGIADVTYSLTLGTAEATDIGTPSIAAGTLTWADGDTADKVIVIPIIDDAISEAYETINFNLSGPTNGAVLGTNAASMLTIQPSDAVRISGLNGFKAIKIVDTDLDTITVGFGGKTGFLDIFKTDDQAPIGLMQVGGGADPLKASISVKVSKAKGSQTADGKSNIGAIIGTGVKSISATKSDLVGDGINLTGALGSVKIGNILNGADIIAAGTAAQKTSITAGTVGDGTVIQLGSVLNSLSALSFGDSDIVAPSAGKITVKGNFSGDITLSGLGVDHLKKKTLASLSATGTVNNADLNVTGNIGALATKVDWTNSTINGYSLAKMTVGGNLTNTDITLSGISVNHLKSAKSLGTLTVKKVTSDSDISVVGNVGAVTTYGFVNSRLFGGYTGPDNGVGGTFNPTIKTTIGSFKSLANAKAGLTGLFDNSSIIAEKLTAATLAAVDEANGADEFGIFVNDSFKTVSITDTKQKFAGIAFNDQDFSIKIV